MSRVGYVSDSTNDLLAEFTPIEYWKYCIHAHERVSGTHSPDILERAVDFSRLLDLPFARRVPLAGLSLGTARKAQLIAGFMTLPDLLILDEPFLGLDFLASRALESVLAQLRDAGTAIVVSNHDLDLAARLADQLMVLHQGAVLLNEHVETLGGHSRVEQAISNMLVSARRKGTDVSTVT